MTQFETGFSKSYDEPVLDHWYELRLTEDGMRWKVIRVSGAPGGDIYATYAAAYREAQKRNGQSA